MPRVGAHVTASRAEYIYVTLKGLDHGGVQGEGLFKITGPGLAEQAVLRRGGDDS